MNERTPDLRLAVLIDGENVSPRIADELFRTVAGLGIAVVRKVFGDWRGSVAGWKGALSPLALEPVQQFSYAPKNNAADMALVIAAMDLLHREEVDGFCIVSGDSDFTPLAVRLRTAQKPVYGFGPPSTSKAFVAACDQFFHLNVAPSPPRPAPVRIDDDAVVLLKRAVQTCGRSEGWATLASVGDWLSRAIVGYRPSKWGARTLSKVLTATGEFELELSDRGIVRVRLPLVMDNVLTGNAERAEANGIAAGSPPSVIDCEADSSDATLIDAVGIKSCSRD